MVQIKERTTKMDKTVMEHGGHEFEKEFGKVLILSNYVKTTASIKINPDYPHLDYSTIKLDCQNKLNPADITDRVVVWYE